MNYLAIDCETGGLSPLDHSLLSAAFILFDPDFEVLESVHILIQPQPDKVILPQAALINGYNEEKWKDAIPLDSAMKQLSDWTKELPDVRVLAHNAQFDQRFLMEAEFVTNHQLHIPRSWECTLEAFKRWRFLTNTPGSCRLDALCEILNFQRSPFHDALEDAAICGRGYQWLTKNGLTR